MKTDYTQQPASKEWLRKAVVRENALPAEPHEPRIYPCAKCGFMRTASEGGTTFTVCDDCWNKSRQVSHSTGVTIVSAVAEVYSLRDKNAALQSQLAEAQRERDGAAQQIAALADPQIVYANMLRGTIAMPRTAQLDEAERQRDAARADVERLTGALERAPHSMFCETRWGDKCSCWKSTALAPTPVAQEGV